MFVSWDQEKIFFSPRKTTGKEIQNKKMKIFRENSLMILRFQREYNMNS